MNFRLSLLVAVFLVCSVRTSCSAKRPPTPVKLTSSEEDDIPSSEDGSSSAAELGVEDLGSDNSEEPGSSSSSQSEDDNNAVSSEDLESVSRSSSTEEADDDDSDETDFDESDNEKSKYKSMTAKINELIADTSQMHTVLSLIIVAGVIGGVVLLVRWQSKPGGRLAHVRWPWVTRASTGAQRMNGTAYSELSGDRIQLDANEMPMSMDRFGDAIAEDRDDIEIVTK